jgi:hypothetical protein
MLTLIRMGILVVVVFLSTLARADGSAVTASPPAAIAASPPAAVTASPPATETSTVDRPSVELNVLWPFFPGGITELRFLLPLVRAHEDTMRGSFVAGVYSDFASRVVRDETHGKVANLSAKIGWRQYFIAGLHAEAAFNIGWRHEAMRPPNNETFDGFQIRLWTHVGYEHQISSRFYANLRGALGIHIYRSGPYASLEKKLAPGADLNFGVRF